MRHYREIIKIGMVIIGTLIFTVLVFQIVLFPMTAKNSLSGMTPLQKGVYAKEDKTQKTVYLRYTKDVMWNEKTFEYNGTKIRLLTPK